MSKIDDNVLITGPVTPGDTTDVFPSHIDIYGKGGYRTVVDQTERNAITPERRSEGMFVKQLDDSTYWTLAGGILDANWLQIFGIVDDLAYQVVSTFTALPATGSTSLIYLTTDTKIFYYWNGSAYLPINSDVPAGALTTNLGNWNATTNSPTITGGTGNAGDFYIVSVAGTTTIDGISSWEIGDYIWFDDSTSVWRKIDNQSSTHSSNRAEFVVNSHAELVSAFTAINSNYGGGIIRLGSSFHLTADITASHENIVVECDYNQLFMDGYNITVVGNSCYYNNGFFDAGIGGSQFIFTDSVVSSTNYMFYNCRFHKFLEAGSTVMFDLTGVTGTAHLFLKDCYNTGNVTINTYYSQIAVSSSRLVADTTITGCRAIDHWSQSQKYGYTGSSPSVGLYFIHDGSAVFDTYLSPTLYNIISSVSMVYPSGSGIPTVAAGVWGDTITPATGYLRYTGAAFEWKNETYLTTLPAHNLIDTTNHAVSGLTAGHFLKALTPTTYGFAAHGLTYSDVGAAATSHTHGNITNVGAIGSTAGLMVKTTTSGVLTTLAAGSAGQFLRYDGTWDTPAGTSQWTDTTGGIYYANKVMIGAATAPSHILTVSSTQAKAGTYENVISINSTDATNQLRLKFGLNNSATAGSRSGVIQVVEEGVDYRSLLLNPDGGNVGIGTTTPLSWIKLDVANGQYGWSARFGATSTNGLLLGQINGVPSIGGENNSNISLNPSEGNVGIGLTDADEKLEVYGNIKVSSASIPTGIVALKPSYFGYSNTYKALVVGDVTGSSTISMGYDPVGNSSGSFTGDGREILFRNGVQFVTPNAANTSFNLTNLVLKDGNVGIGTTNPAYVLDVNGTCRIGTLGGLIYGTSGALSAIANGTNGQILVANSSGIPVWVSAGSLAIAGGSNTQIQFNQAGSLGGTDKLTWNATYGYLILDGSEVIPARRLEFMLDEYGLRFRDTSTYAKLHYTSNQMVIGMGGSSGTSYQNQFKTIYNGATSLSYAGNVKLATRTDGVDITGGLCLSTSTLSTAVAGIIEYDGRVFYGNVLDSTRGLLITEQFIALSSDYTLASSSSPQRLIGLGSLHTFTLASNTAYMFECNFSVSDLSSSTGSISFGFTTTATATGYFNTIGTKSGSNLAGAAVISYATSITSGIVVTAANTSTYATVRATGVIRVTTGGTIYPVITTGVAVTGAVVKSGSFMRLWPIGVNTVVRLGNLV